ncbi:calcium-binding protein [Phaeobacter porticola]|uniref:Hemolysin-type calcium-binding protein repeat protein (2 copies) n=1 Tax=Phaeobacter porticola TaxID=1844006 RepID=A0A1L3IA49_9RHOB|nr:calcium-binding protein [Phaeobacter porticola]APG49007.1 Hemolysin-type calcium-binding protein repeat protein (2 copies) [Phaeobacter porticola]
MANVFVASFPGVSSLSNYLAFDGFETSRASFDTVISATELEQTADDGSVLRIGGDFSSVDQATWQIYSIDHSLNGAPIVSISNISMSFDRFASLPAGDLARAFLSGDDAITALLNDNVTEIQTFGGNDRVSLGAGNDTVAGGVGSDFITGGLGVDSLRGGHGADTLHGNGGDDILRGGVGRDLLFGGIGDDILGGGKGHDRLIGGSGNDIIRGGAGVDRLFGGTGDDILSGGTGADIFVFNQGDHTDRITDFEIGIDRIKLGRGAEDMGDVDFGQVDDNVAIYFANVTVFVEDMTIADLQNPDHFLF